MNSSHVVSTVTRLTMRKLSPGGQDTISELAERHGFSREAVMSMLESVASGKGTMAQFDHPEFGGSGQWMGGGMTMVSDMFNDALKVRVAELCSELSKLVADDPVLARGGSVQSQSQRDGRDQRQSAPGRAEHVSLFVPASIPRQWWPAELGAPNSSGAQNAVRYAYFMGARRLAIEVDGKVTVYDTLDHQIGSFSQEQSHAGSLSFHSQHGLVDVASLPVVSTDGKTI